MSAGSKLLLEYALEINEPYTLMISHDAIITLLSLFLFEDQDVEQFLPDFLEGLFIEHDENGLTIYYKEYIRDLSWEKFQEMLSS